MYIDYTKAPITPQKATYQLRALRDRIIDAAKRFLEESGEVYPFGAVMVEDGTIFVFNASNIKGRSTRPLAPHEYVQKDDAVIRLIFEFCQKMRPICVGSCRVAPDFPFEDEDMPDEPDSLWLKTEHVIGRAVEYYLPYEPTGQKGEFEYGEITQDDQCNGDGDSIFEQAREELDASNGVFTR